MKIEYVNEDDFKEEKISIKYVSVDGESVPVVRVSELKRLKKVFKKKINRLEQYTFIEDRILSSDGVMMLFNEVFKEEK